MYASTERVWEQQHSNSNKHTDLPDLAFSTLFSTKKNKDSLETTNSRARAGKLQDKSEISSRARKQENAQEYFVKGNVKKKKKTTKTRNQPEGALIGQI